MPSDVHERARFFIDESRVVGISTEETLWLRGHLAECPACARHEETTARILAALMESASVGPIHELPRPVWPARKPAPRRWWPLAAAAMILLIAAPVYKSIREARQARADDVLLERVEAGVRRTVPAALEPLMQPQAGEIR